MMKQLARLKFSGNGLRVPDGWQPPTGSAASHYSRAFKPEEKMTAPDTTVPPLFMPHSANKYHTDTQKNLTQIFGSFIDGIIDAICATWSTWQSAATMVNIQIMAVSGIGGQVQGPPWTPLILAQGPKGSAQQMKYTNVIASVIGQAWSTYQSTIVSPGLPFWPMFAAFPLAAAPPTPGVPLPFMSLTQVAVSLGASTMKQQMVGQLGDPKAQYANELFDAVCSAFEQCFTLWQTTTLISNVIGFGPVPTFAPPYVPVGPVMGGQGVIPPGGFT